MKDKSAEQVFYGEIETLYQQYRPSKHSFFVKLANFPYAKLRSPILLGELYLRYQAACHSTRVMVYYLPHLNSPNQRVRKLSIINDDDGTIGNTHHHQLSQAFIRMGALLPIQDEEFNDLETLERYLDEATARFILTVKDLYPQSLGAWCIVERFAEDWMYALMNGFLGCFPFIKDEPYFADCLPQRIEKKHAQESLNLTGEVLLKHPDKLEKTIKDSYTMALELDGFWFGLENFLIENE